jgi:hypothetical protein
MIRARVSDHAVVRFLERVKGMDIEKIRREILSETVLAAIAMGARAVEIEGHKFTIVDGCITTCLPPGANGFSHGAGRGRR